MLLTPVILCHKETHRSSPPSQKQHLDPWRPHPNILSCLPVDLGPALSPEGRSLRYMLILTGAGAWQVCIYQSRAETSTSTRSSSLNICISRISKYQIPVTIFHFDRDKRGLFQFPGKNFSKHLIVRDVRDNIILREQNSSTPPTNLCNLVTCCRLFSLHTFQNLITRKAWSPL